MKDVDLSKLELENMQLELFKINSLARVLKFASATAYTKQIDEDDIQVVMDAISDIANKLVDTISEKI